MGYGQRGPRDADRRRSAPRFDFTVNVSTLLSLVAILAAIWGARVSLEHRITAVETKVELLLHPPTVR